MVVSSAVKYASFAAVGAGGLGAIAWTTISLLSPYESKWYGNVEGFSGASLVCGKIKDKYDCKLSLSLSSAGGGTQAIRVTNITEILKKGEGSQKATANTLYLFDKETSTLWYIFKGQGPWGELKITTEGQGETLKPVINKDCTPPQAKCKGHVGEKVDEKFEKRWNDVVAKWTWTGSRPKTISAKNIVWKLSYL